MMERVKENEVYGKLRVIKILGAIKENQRDFYCEVVCECGEHETVLCTKLATGKKTMCKKCSNTPSKSLIKLGTRFGKLTVIGYEENHRVGTHYKYKVLCDCGNEQMFYSTQLKHGRNMCTKCMYLSKGNHFMSDTKLYRVYRGIKRRCYKDKCTGYNNYGGRGIKMCQEWKESPKKFFEWALENGYKEGLSIDRINVNGDYEPSNCRWVTPEVQANNTRANKIVKYRGKEHTYAEWDKIKGYKKNTVGRRIRAGWSIKRAIETK